MGTVRLENREMDALFEGRTVTVELDDEQVEIEPPMGWSP